MAGGDGVTVKGSYRVESCQGVQFWVPERFQGLVPVGSASNGHVCKATDREDGEEVAIKRIEWRDRNARGVGYWVKVWHFFFFLRESFCRDEVDGAPISFPSNPSPIDSTTHPMSVLCTSPCTLIFYPLHRPPSGKITERQEELWSAFFSSLPLCLATVVRLTHCVTPSRDLPVDRLLARHDFPPCRPLWPQFHPHSHFIVLGSFLQTVLISSILLS